MTTSPFVCERLDPRLLMAATAWSDTIDNKYMPLLPGATWLYTGIKDGVFEKNRLIVQSTTRQIIGVTCTTVLDRVYLGGKLAEKTHDFFAQDTLGNVWYLGEDSRDIENGKVVSTEGSWLSGVNGAQPGIIMEANPGVGDLYRQEFQKDVAEDQAQVVSLHHQADSSFGTFKSCLDTTEFNRLDPGVLEHKFYAAGIGLIKSTSFMGEHEVLRLVQYIP